MKVDIVIVNYNSGNCLKQCMASLDKYDSDFIKTITVIDNSSYDNSNKIDLSLFNNFSKINILNQDVNLGFAKACNLGAKQENSDFILFLNPDTYLSEDIFQGLFQIPAEELKSQITGANLLDEEDKNSISAAHFPSFLMLSLKSIGAHKIIKSLDKQLIKFSKEGKFRVDVASGAFFFISREIYKKLDGFDERFFVYYEEVDLALRARNELGVDCVIDTRHKINHIGGSCTQNSSYSLSLNISSKLLYSKKHFKVYQHYCLLFLTFVIEVPIRLVTRIMDFKNLSPLIGLYTKLGDYVK